MDVAAALLTECGVPAADAGGDRSGVEVLNVALSIKIKIKKNITYGVPRLVLIK